MLPKKFIQIDNLEFTLTGALGVSKGRWSLMSDLIYLDMKNDKDIAPGVNVSFDVAGHGRLWLQIHKIRYGRSL